MIKNILGPILIVLCLPAVAYADAGVPMIYLSFPAMIIALLPVIFIETSVFKRIVPVTYKKSFVSNGVANAISTIVGFPIAWGLLFGLELLTTGGSCGPGFDSIPNSIITVIVEAAWLCPHEDHLYWLVPTAFIISLIMAFFISLTIEYFVNKKFHKEHDKKFIRKAVIIANLASYCLLVLAGLGFLVFAIIDAG
jgi:hypothetical protein